MSTNWKEETEAYKKLYKKYSKRPNWHGTSWLMVLACILTIVFLAILGSFNSPVSELDIDKDTLVDYHVKKYYPEFENCTIEQDCIQHSDSFLVCKKGASVYCDVLESRDNLKVVRENDPTEELIFEGITFEDMLLDKCGLTRK